MRLMANWYLWGQSEQENKMKKERNSNIELLRILSMLLIVAYHSMRMGYNSPLQPTHVYITGVALGSWGILGVDIFLIISAWFMIDQPFKTKRIFDYVLQIGMYMLAFYVVRFVIVLNRDGCILVAIKDSVLHFTDGLLEPLWCSEYWFVTAYFFLYLTHPFLNRILHTWDAQTIRKLIIVGSFVPIYSNFAPYGGVAANYAFVAYIYLLVGYIKNHVIISKALAFRIKCVATVIPVVVIASKAMSDFCESSGLIGYVNNFTLRVLGNTDRFSCILLAEALCVFLLIIRLRPKMSRIVNFVSANVFGVYLLHEKGPFEINLIDIVFSEAESSGYLSSSSHFVIHYLSIVLGIFAVGVVVEYFRVKVLHKPISDFLYKKLSRKISALDLIMGKASVD